MSIERNKQMVTDKLYLRMAFVWSEKSYALRRKVGCLIVKDNSIISDGYNGTPSGFPNVCEYAVEKESGKTEKYEFPTAKVLKDFVDEEYAQYKDVELKTYQYTLHAEANAITKLAKSNNSSVGATIYCTDEPCVECAKLIIQAGITRVVYCREYRIHAGLELLQEANIIVEQIKI